MRTIARRKLKGKTPKASVGQRPEVVTKRDKQISFYCTEEFYGQIQAESGGSGVGRLFLSEPRSEEE